MSVPATMNCSACGAVLLTEGLPPGQPISCNRCSAALKAPGVAPARPISKKAAVCLVLGVCSVVGALVTGLAAMLVGISALADIKRSGGRLRGRGLAIGGIATGSVLGLSMGLCYVGLYVFWLNFTFTQDPQVVSEIASEMATFRLPRGVRPQGGARAAGMSWAVFGDDDRNFLILMRFPPMMAQDPDQMQAQARTQMQQQGWSGNAQFNVRETREQSYLIRGENVLVTESIGTMDADRPVRQYFAVVPGGDRPSIVMLMIDDRPVVMAPPLESPLPGGAAPAENGPLTEQEVQAFFESFR